MYFVQIHPMMDTIYLTMEILKCLCAKRKLENVNIFLENVDLLDFSSFVIYVSIWFHVPLRFYLRSLVNSV